MSPTQRSIKLLKDAGWQVLLVEHWNHHAKCRVDLFGILDLLALKGPDTLGVQTTDASSISKRQHKIEASEWTAPLLEAGWRIQTHGWRKNHSALIRELTPDGWIDLDSAPTRRLRDPASVAAPATEPGAGGSLQGREAVG